MQTTFDAIVIGSGTSGGWAAKELCEHGAKTLVLERGRNIVHNKDYPTANLHPWELPHHGRMLQKFLEENPLISKAAGFGEDTAHFFIKDKDHPYVQEKTFRLDPRVKWNQLHACKNVFVTDGACMTTTGNQSPSISYMTLTARAANFAIAEMKSGNLQAGGVGDFDSPKLPI